VRGVRLRILCKSPPQPVASDPVASDPSVYVYPSLEDTRVVLVGDDGSEADISALVQSVTWWTSSNEPTRATVTFRGAEIEAEAIPGEGDEAYLEIAALRARVAELEAEKGLLAKSVADALTEAVEGDVLR